MVARTKKSRRAVGGFTLLELLVVLTIAGLLVALVPPALSAALPGAKLSAATRGFVATLRESRNLAIGRGIEVDVIFDTEEHQIEIADLRPQDLPGGINIDVRGQALAADNRLFVLRFYPDGSSSGAVVQISQGRSAYLVDVDWLLGTVEVTKAKAHAYR